MGTSLMCSFLRLSVSGVTCQSGVALYLWFLKESQRSSSLCAAGNEAEHWFSTSHMQTFVIDISTWLQLLTATAIVSRLFPVKGSRKHLFLFRHLVYWQVSVVFVLLLPESSEPRRHENLAWPHLPGGRHCCGICIGLVPLSSGRWQLLSLGKIEKWP